MTAGLTPREVGATVASAAQAGRAATDDANYLKEFLPENGRLATGKTSTSTRLAKAGSASRTVAGVTVNARLMRRWPSTSVRESREQRRQSVLIVIVWSRVHSR